MQFKPARLLILALIALPALAHAAPAIKCHAKRNIGWSEYKPSSVLVSGQSCIKNFYRENISSGKSYLTSYELESTKAKNGGTECVWRWHHIVNPDALSLGLNPPSGAPRVISCVIQDKSNAVAHKTAAEEVEHDHGSAE